MNEDFSIAVLISGGGTTLRNLIAHRAEGRPPLNISLVVSSNPRAAGIAFAREAGIPVKVIDHRDYSTPDDFSTPIFEACRGAKVDLVVLGGFLRRLSIPADFENRVVNIHPSLIPRFAGRGMYGMRVHEAVLASGVTTTGCTVHFVDNDYDHGPVIARSEVPVEPGDTPGTLAARVFAAECELYPQVIQSLADSR